MPDDEKKFTQEDVDRFIQERLAREKARYSDYDEIKAENADLKAKAEKAGRETLSALKIDVATAFKLPEKLASRLSGTSKEELEADAKKLLEEIGPKEPVGGAGSPASETKKPISRDAIKQMTPQQIIDNMDQIKAQMADGSLNRG